MYKHHVAVENAAKFAEWITHRGGVANWASVDLSNPGKSMSSPALSKDGQPTARPHWSLDVKPSMVITDPSEIGVYSSKEVERFHVGVRRGSQGMSLKLTDASSARLKKKLDQQSGNGRVVHYEFDYGCQDAVIFLEVDEGSLQQWMAKNPPGADGHWA